MCMTCNQASVATVTLEDGTQQRMMHCKRADCDNWIYENVNADEVIAVIEDEEQK